jgi:hypothetical protein
MLPLAGVEATRNTGDMATASWRPTSWLLTGYADAGVRLALKDAETGSTALLRKPASGTALAERAAALMAHAAEPCG